MKTAIITLLSAAVVSHAAIVQFDLSPPGTDAAVGMRPANEVPAVTNSTGSGGEISGGISFDTVAGTLTFAIGYGSSAGFTDLTSPASAMHIHGTAGAGTNAPVLISLVPFHFPAANPARGGVVIGSVVYPTNQIANLFAGLHYVNIHTPTNTGGEIRAQLIPLVNVAPQVVCPGPATIECGPAATFSATVSDADGEPLQVVWTLNGVAVQTNNIAAGGPPTSAVVTFTASLPLGTNTLGVAATDSTGNTTSCSSTVTVVDTIAPVITAVSANPPVLWPPNHKMIAVRVRATVTDECGPTTWRIISVSSNEPVDGQGDGNTSPDWEITDDHSVMLRAERSGKNKAGRTYTITVRARDAAGNLSDPGIVRVLVPHDQGNKR